jgi:hypothetical protein
MADYLTAGDHHLGQRGDPQKIGISKALGAFSNLAL